MSLGSSAGGRASEHSPVPSPESRTRVHAPFPALFQRGTTGAFHFGFTLPILSPNTYTYIYIYVLFSEVHITPSPSVHHSIQISNEEDAVRGAWCVVQRS